MPVANYSVLKGKPTAEKVVQGSSAHCQITVQGTGGPFTIAVNIESVGGSEVLYVIEHGFTPPSLTGLTALATGIHSLASKPGGLALDFVREQIAGKPMVTLAQMTLLPRKASAHELHNAKPEHLELERIRAKVLQNAVVTLIQQAIAEGDSTIYAFGSSFADSGRVDGIHNIHMNQGNPSPGSFAGDNGIWQDGGLFVNMPKQAKPWTAVFIAFQTESWNTDGSGNPV